MTEQEEIIERIKALELEGGSHEMLSSIAKAIYKPTCGGWTIGACQVLRDTLVNLLSETDEEALREAYTKGREDGMGVANKADMQAEYLRGKNDGYDEGWDAGFASADDWLAQHEDAMAVHGWVKLPKDADGEYIHIGDVMVDRGFPDAKYMVIGIGKDEFFTRDAYGELCEHTASLYIHYKQPTVEDLLRDMHAKLDEVTALYVGEAIDSDERDSDEARIFAEYAKRLRLAGDAE